MPQSQNVSPIKKEKALRYRTELTPFVHAGTCVLVRPINSSNYFSLLDSLFLLLFSALQSLSPACLMRAHVYE